MVRFAARSKKKLFQCERKGEEEGGVLFCRRGPLKPSVLLEGRVLSLHRSGVASQAFEVCRVLS